MIGSWQIIVDPTPSGGEGYIYLQPFYGFTSPRKYWFASPEDLVFTEAIGAGLSAVSESVPVGDPLPVIPLFYANSRILVNSYPIIGASVSANTIVEISVAFELAYAFIRLSYDTK